MEYIATFFTHFGAVKFGRLLKLSEIEHHMMPVPRKLSSSCGTCVRFQTVIPEGVENQEDVEGLYVVEGNEYKCLFVRE